MNLATWVERNGQRLRDEPALADGERVHATWGQFAARTAAAAAGLHDSFGLSPGDRVAIVMRNRPEYLEALYAIWHAGLVAVPVNARLHRDEIAYVLGDSGAAVVITDEDHADDVELLVGTLDRVQAAVLAPSAQWERLTASAPARLVERPPNDPAWLFYTSGTTGRPKGAVLTHQNLLMMFAQLLRRHRRRGAAGLRAARRAALARGRTVRAAPGGPRRCERLPRPGRPRRGTARLPPAPLVGDVLLRRPDHGQAAGQ